MKASLNDGSISRIKTALRFGSVAVSFQRRGTNFNIFLVPCSAIADIESREIDIDRYRLLVVLENFRAAYHFRIGEFDPNYVGEKLGLARPDAESIALFLRELAQN